MDKSDYATCLPWSLSYDWEMQSSVNEILSSAGNSIMQFLRHPYSFGIHKYQTFHLVCLVVRLTIEFRKMKKKFCIMRKMKRNEFAQIATRLKSIDSSCYPEHDDIFFSAIWLTVHATKNKFVWNNFLKKMQSVRVFFGGKLAEMLTCVLDFML